MTTATTSTDPTPAQVRFAYLNWGRWVADCPCGNALMLAAGQPTMQCAVLVDGVTVVSDGMCGTTVELLWPDVAAVEASVAGLPPAQQHWTPRFDEDTDGTPS